ncbi:MAG: YceI family protein [Acetobacteraceae bacterium]
MGVTMVSLPLLLAALLILPGAAPRTLRLVPPQASLEMRAYAIGFLPIDSRFTRFDGTLTYDQAEPARCTATLTAQVASLETAKATMRETILGADFLDAAQFPTLGFTGTCTQAGTLAGSLTMRGVAHPLVLRLERSAHGLAAEGEVRRALWGMDARPFMVGPMIRIRVTAPLP